MSWTRGPHASSVSVIASCSSLKCSVALRYRRHCLSRYAQDQHNTLLSLHKDCQQLAQGLSALQVLEVVEAVGKLNGERPKRAQESFESQKGHRTKFPMLCRCWR